jgi:DNA excision repair protein ERCC-2
MLGQLQKRVLGLWEVPKPEVFPVFYRFCYDRLSSLMKTLEIADTDDYYPLHLVADFGTLLGTYARGFAVIIEPFDERLPHIPDPVLQLR